MVQLVDEHYNIYTCDGGGFSCFYAVVLSLPCWRSWYCTTHTGNNPLLLGEQKSGAEEGWEVLPTFPLPTVGGANNDNTSNRKHKTNYLQTYIYTYPFSRHSDYGNGGTGSLLSYVLLLAPVSPRRNNKVSAVAAMAIKFRKGEGEVNTVLCACYSAVESRSTTRTV